MNRHAPERPTTRRPAEPASHRDYPHTPHWAWQAVRLCRHIETGQSLAALLKRVPDDYVTDGIISCPCGTKVQTDIDAVTFCEGPACGRIFIVGTDGVWAARLPAGEDDA